MNFAPTRELVYFEHMMKQVPRDRQNQKVKVVKPTQILGTDTLLTPKQAILFSLNHIEHYPFKNRLKDIIYRKEAVSMFHTKRHELLFTTEHQRIKSKAIKLTNRLLAVLYLLTSSEHLWLACKSKFHTKNIVINSCPADCSPDNYAIYKAAKEICTGDKHITLTELADNEVISAHAFSLIVQAMTIARVGTKYITLQQNNRRAYEYV